MSLKEVAEGHGGELFVLAMALLLIVLLTISGCGLERDSQDTQPPDDPKFSAIAGIVKDKCGACHKFDTGAKFKAAGSKLRLESDSMPPVNKLDAATKQKLLAYLNG